MQDIRLWQQRPLDSQYAVLWIDAIHYKIRQDGKVQSKACMVVLGINMQGIQEILGLYIMGQESASGWMHVLTDLKHRGMEDALFLCSDNLTGIQKAVETAFPKVIHQICIVHQVRNSLKYVKHSHKKAFIKSLKSIYQSSNEAEALDRFEQFKEQWGDKYTHAVKSWQNNWVALTAFLQYPQTLPKLIYTTNIIESFNASLRKYTKNKKVFPNDDAALKSIYLAAQNIKFKWSKTRFNWTTIYNELFIYFENRIIH